MEAYQYFNLQQWLQHISVNKHQVTYPGLNNVRTVAEKLELLTFDIPVITVGGTNGKGSTVAFIESLLLELGYAVGAVCSPHLLDYNERTRLQGMPVSDEALCEAFTAIENLRQEVMLTYFEYTVLASLYIFKKSTLDFIVLEIGLGGRLDAFNIVDPDVSIVTTIDLDHVAILGDTREKIAYEKAGIFRSGKPALCGDINVPDSLTQHTEEIKAPLFVYEKDFYTVEHQDSWEFHGFGYDFTHLPKPSILIKNAALAMAGLLLLKPPLALTEELLKKAIKNLTISGRYETLASSPEVIIDVAHNPQSTTLLANRLKGFVGKTFGVFSILKTKDIITSILPCIPVIDEWYIAEIEDPLALSLDSLQNTFKELKITAVKSFPTIIKAYETAYFSAKKEDRIIVFGSFHTVAPVLRLLRKG